jgi:hypothetical protein
MSADPLIVTFSDAQYLPLLDQWVQRLERLGLRRIRIYGLDATTVAWCRRRGVDSVALSWKHGDLRDLWIQRIQVFTSLLREGEEIIHSDSDAVWLRNPLQCGSAVGRSEDLLFSQGTVWPPDVHDAWGFVLCCGWFRARATPGVLSFFSALQEDVRSTGDDQISVNRLLHAAGADWEQDDAAAYRLPFREGWMRCWKLPIVARLRAPALSVALLPHREFQRLPETTPDAVVKHFLTPKDCGEKLAVMRKLGLIEAGQRTTLV